MQADKSRREGKKSKNQIYPNLIYIRYHFYGGLKALDPEKQKRGLINGAPVSLRLGRSDGAALEDGPDMGALLALLGRMAAPVERPP